MSSTSLSLHGPRAMHDIEQVLQKQVSGFASIGHPALVERFTLAKGKVYDTKRKLSLWPEKNLMTPKQCFQNAADLVVLDSTLEYVEGYAMREDFGFPFQHAWVESADGHFTDPTLRNADQYQYIGVPWSCDDLWAEIERTKVYGLYDLGVCINLEFLLKHMPQLREDVKEACGCVLP